MSSLDSASSLTTATVTTGVTQWYVSINGDICYAAGGSSNKIAAINLLTGTTTLLPFTSSTSIGSFTQDGTWFYYLHTGLIRLHKIRMTAVGAGGNPNLGPPAADSIGMALVDISAPFGAVAVGPDGTLYVSERDTSTGPFYIKSVQKSSPFTRTTVASIPQHAVYLAIDADNTIWAVCATGTTDVKLYKISGGTATVWSGASTVLMNGICVSGDYVYVTHYPTTGTSRFPGTAPKAIQVSRFSKATAGTYTTMVGSLTFGFADGAGSTAKFQTLRSIGAYGTETLIVHDNTIIRKLFNAAPPPGPAPRSKVCIPPWPDTIVLRPLIGGVGLRSDSAALCADGRVIYCWVNGTTALNQSHYPTVEDFASANNLVATAGVNLLPVFGISAPIATVWRNYAVTPQVDLFLLVSGFAGGMDVTRVYKSPSGNGESAPGVPDWVLHATIQAVAQNPPFDKGQGERCMGEPYVTPDGRWMLTTSEWQEWQGLWTSDDYGLSWTFRKRLGWYLFGGAYGYGLVRNILKYQGKYWFSGSGNVESAKGAYSTVADNGTTWTEFNWPGTGNSDLAQIVTATDGIGMQVVTGGTFYGAPAGMENTIDPLTDTRAQRTMLIPNFPGGLQGILQRIGDCDYYMINGQILMNRAKGWGVGIVRWA